jgi:hypothetical protein
VIVVALGAALGAALDVLGGWVSSLETYAGWISFAPLAGNTNLSSSGGGLLPWERFAMWVGLTVLWAAAALVLLRTPPSNERATVDVTASDG